MLLDKGIVQESLGHVFRDEPSCDPNNTLIGEVESPLGEEVLYVLGLLLELLLATSLRGLPEPELPPDTAG